MSGPWCYRVRRMNPNGKGTVVLGRKPRVRLEKNLEAFAGSWRHDRRRRMARVYYRWAKQLWKSADILEADELRYGPAVVHWQEPEEQKGN